jgi:hypothetical protein
LQKIGFKIHLEAHGIARTALVGTRLVVYRKQIFQLYHNATPTVTIHQVRNATRPIVVVEVVVVDIARCIE